MRSSLLTAAALAILALPGIAFAQTSTGTTAPAAAANPPGTVVSRTFDRAAGTDTSGAYPSQADGTKENPKGTMASRAANRAGGSVHRATHRNEQTSKNNSASRTLDRTAGTNTSGAYPSQTDGTPGNPPGTMVSRALGTTNPK